MTARYRVRDRWRPVPLPDDVAAVLARWVADLDDDETGAMFPTTPDRSLRRPLDRWHAGGTGG